jgi:hypothetical protein
MATISSQSTLEKPVLTSKNTWWTKKKLIIGGMILAMLVLGVGLGVGLGCGHGKGNSGDSGSTTPTSTSTPTSNSTTNSTGIWQPTPGTTWNYELYEPLNDTATNNISVWGIDLFDNPATTIRGLQSNGAKVICYFSAGSYENWRPDKGNFTSSDMGSTLSGWPDEKWLNTSSPNVRKIMRARLDLAEEKGCNGVDPDNMDGYDNSNGLGLTQADAVDYMTFLANEAHQRNISIGLKNAGTIIPNVIDFMQWSINEECVQYSECSTYAPFITQNKPVFHVEYPKGDNTNNNIAVSSTVKSKICDDSTASGFSTIIKNILLDAWVQTC